MTRPDIAIRWAETTPFGAPAFLVDDVEDGLHVAVNVDTSIDEALAVLAAFGDCMAAQYWRRRGAEGPPTFTIGRTDIVPGFLPADWDDRGAEIVIRLRASLGPQEMFNHLADVAATALEAHWERCGEAGQERAI